MHSAARCHGRLTIDATMLRQESEKKNSNDLVELRGHGWRFPRPAGRGNKSRYIFSAPLFRSINSHRLSRLFFLSSFFSVFIYSSNVQLTISVIFFSEKKMFFEAKSGAMSRCVVSSLLNRPVPVKTYPCPNRAGTSRHRVPLLCVNAYVRPTNKTTASWVPCITTNTRSIIFEVPGPFDGLATISLNMPILSRSYEDLCSTPSSTSTLSAIGVIFFAQLNV